MSNYDDDFGELSSELENEISPRDISCSDTCSICGKTSVAYLHPIEDGTPCVACEECATKLVEEGFHREYPFESASDSEDVSKKIVDGWSNLILFRVEDNGVPMSESWIKMPRKDAVVVASFR